MSSMLDAMLEAYDARTTDERRNAFREIAQEVVLCGLSRAGFFSKAAFYGGTALRVFHGLDRFSEDMDFSLMQPDGSFSFEPYLPQVERECAAWGLRFSAIAKGKRAGSAIDSAFLKANTKEHLLTLFTEDGTSDAIPADEVLKIKLEIDTDPAPLAAFESEYRLLPMPFEATLYDMPSLFAGKTHAVICRAWKNRVKGRDLYDFVFYLARDTRLNLEHLAAKLEQTSRIESAAEFALSDAKALLHERFNAIDYEQAKADVRPFVSNPAALDVWSAGFFHSLIDKIRVSSPELR